MKKFSFKKLATVSLFFTSIIFTSAFTTCFVPTISTSHSNNDITAVDLSQYDGQYLPGAEDLDKKPSDRVILRCLVTAGWIEHENGIDISNIGVGGNHFKLTPRSGLNYYTGLATIWYTLITPTGDISSIITNPMLNATIDYDLWNDSTLSKQYILSQFKQMYPTLDTNELDITADYSSDVVLKSGIGTATISVKSESLVYVSDSVDVRFRFKPRLDKVLTMGDLNINDFTTTSIYSPSWYLEAFDKNYDRLNNDCDLFKDALNIINSSTSVNSSLTFSLKPSNTIFYSGSLPVTLSVFDQYIDTVPDDFSYTYNADNLTASVTGFADPDHITHMDANRLYIPDTVINSDDGQTYTITGISNGAFNVVLSDYSPNKQGLAYNLLIDNGTIKFIRYPFGLSNIGVRTFGLNYRGAAQPKYSSIKGSFIPSGTFTVAQEGLSISYSIIYISQGLNLPTRSSQYLSQFRDIEPNHLRWIEVNPLNPNLEVLNNFDQNGNLIGQLLIPKNGFTASSTYSTGAGWGKVDLTNAFNYSFAQLPNSFFKYHQNITDFVFPSPMSTLGSQQLRFTYPNSCTFPFWDGTQGVTGWYAAFGYAWKCKIYVPSEAISWYESQSDYDGCTILPIQ